MKTDFKNYTEEQTETYIKKVSGLIREYLGLESNNGIFNIDDLHISVYQNLLNEDLDDAVSWRKQSCMDILKLLANPTVNKLLDEGHCEDAVKLISTVHAFYESLEWKVNEAILHLTFIEQFGYGKLEDVAYFEKEYSLKLELAKHKKLYESKAA